MVAQRRLTAAFWDYDRTRPLADGRVTIPGVDLVVTLSAPEATFAKAATAEFDISELSFSNSATRLSEGKLAYGLIPVFLSRAFRHSAIFVRQDRGITEPRHLRGKAVGVQEYDMTAAVVVRGFLRDQFGVLPEEIRWRVGEEHGGKPPHFAGSPPAGLVIDIFPPGSSLESRLLRGELDAIITLRPSPHLTAPGNGVGRLFPRPREVEMRWLQSGGIFPIMHVVGIRRQLVEAEPRLAARLYEAFSKAKQIAIGQLEISQAPKVTLPWPHFAVSEARSLLGDDFWPYGIEANAATIETQLRWSWLDGLQARRLTVADLFPAFAGR